MVKSDGQSGHPQQAHCMGTCAHLLVVPVVLEREPLRDNRLRDPRLLTDDVLRQLVQLHVSPHVQDQQLVGLRDAGGENLCY